VKPPHLILKTALLVLLSSAALHGQVLFERDDIMVAVGWKPGDPITKDITPQKTYQNPAWRAKMFRQFPAADANRDGALTEAEAINYHLTHIRRFTPQGGELDYLPAGTSRRTEYVPMRDGQKLPVEVYLPPGKGPWPVVLIRTTRGRIDSALDYANELLRLGIAAVGGDLTPEGDFINADELGRAAGGREMSREDRASFNARRIQRNSANDGADTIAWLVRQPWSDGNIGMTGYSEAAGQTKNALSTNPPDLDVVVTAIGTLSRQLNPFTTSRGAPVDWVTGKYTPPGQGGWEAPTLRANPGQGALIESAIVPNIHYDDRTGWFDFAAQGAIEEWKKMRSNGKSRLIIGIGGHGRVSTEARMQPDYGDADLLFPQIEAFEWLRGKDPTLARSRFYYFLMGDATNPDAPGNVWKVTDTWPVAGQEVSWYLHPDRTLQPGRSEAADGSVGYVHDPRNPIQTLNGNYMPPTQYGPRDQRHLDQRDDVLLFTSAALEAPVEITGQPWVELYVSTDAPDTQFVVQLLDIYPDGYKWPIRENAVIARFHDVTGQPQPLQPGKVYRLKIPLISTALVLDRGHKLGLQVMSSSYPSYAVHPNTWDSIASYDQAKPARQKIYASAEHPSRIVLPVVAAGSSRDYDPAADANLPK
jgi:predicted acyl esterase